MAQGRATAIRLRPRPTVASAFFTLAAALLVAGCVTYIPVDEYTLARSAFDSAKEWDAPRYVPAMWFNAEQAYREGQVAFKERRFPDARNKFVQAKILAEQAENAARLARHQSGDVTP